MTEGQREETHEMECLGRKKGTLIYIPATHVAANMPSTKERERVIEIEQERESESETR